MDHASQTRLEWMRLEFQDARRRHLVKTSEGAAMSQTSTETQPAAPVVLIHPVPTTQRTDHPQEG
jgi:hypothetical protein